VARLAPIRGRALRDASDADLYNFALDYARGHQIGLTGVQGAGAAIGAPAFAPAARLELGRQSDIDATARRRKLIASLARRRTESSRRRALARVTAGWGLTVE
jgi:hypothetical protein